MPGRDGLNLCPNNSAFVAVVAHFVRNHFNGHADLHGLAAPTVRCSFLTVGAGIYNVTCIPEWLCFFSIQSRLIGIGIPLYDYSQRQPDEQDMFQNELNE